MCAELQSQQQATEAAVRELRGQLHDAEQRCTVLQQLAAHRDASMSDMQQHLKVCMAGAHHRSPLCPVVHLHMRVCCGV